MLLIRQISVLTWKNLLLAIIRRPISTPLRALVLPILFAALLVFLKSVFVPYAVYGIASSAHPIRSLSNALANVGGGRNTLAFVRNNMKGGPIDQVISNVSSVALDHGYQVSVLDDPDGLLSICRSSLNGGSQCIAAIQFYSSPSEGPESIWNYTLLTDGSLGTHIQVNKDNNDPEIYALPLQHAIDWTIASLNSTVDSSALPVVEEYPYTSKSQAERAISIRQGYMRALIDFLGVGFFIAICGVSYQQVGAQAMDREMRMSPLLEVMMPNRRRWEPQVARLASYWIAYSLTYCPGWLIIGVILQVGVFQETNVGIVIVHHLLTGMALASSALFVGAFFRRAQLSGITAILINLVLAIIAQVLNSGTGTVAACSFFFPSMNYTWFIILMARWERQDLPTNLVQDAPYSTYAISGIVFWVFLIAQTLLYPIAAVFVERWLWGTTSGRSRKLTTSADVAIELNDFSKVFKPSWIVQRIRPWFRKSPKEDVVAVDSLSFSVARGSILVLLGANGSGKSTTLDAVAGLSNASSGQISVDFEGGLGLCPQQNVLYSELTCEEHIMIFSRLKALDKPASKTERLSLLEDCDLQQKVKSKAGALSGGQMRKLQLAMTFVGGSRVCLIDEVSSGIDALARRKIQNIIFAERQRLKRSIVFTSHYIDEAETVADHVVILSKGKLRIEGSVPSIKVQHASGYRIHVQASPSEVPAFVDVQKRSEDDSTTILHVADPTHASYVLQQLEDTGFYASIHGPQLEDVFRAVADEMAQEAVTAPLPDSTPSSLDDKDPVEACAASQASGPSLDLESGRPIGPLKQLEYLFRKRFTVFRRQPLPNLIALIIPLVAGGLVLLFLKSFSGAGCTPTDQVSQSTATNLDSIAQYNFTILAGPSTHFSAADVSLLEAALGIENSNLSGNESNPLNVSSLTQSLHFVSSLAEFNSYIVTNYHNVTPGGFFFDESRDEATFAYVADVGLATSVLTQNLLDVLATNISIATSYNTFSIPWQADQGNTLQFCIYFGLAMSITPAFFALYPTLERIRRVRAFQYSNGVRPLALWPAYLAFDLIFVTLGVTIAIILFAVVRSSVFFDLGLLWLVLFFWGLNGTLVSYVVSLFAKSQLSAFASAAAFGAISFLLYLVAYLSTLTYAPVNLINQYEEYVYFIPALVLPAASLLRSIFVSLNVLNINCRGVGDYAANGNEMLAYGGPLTYLILQSVVLLGFVIWWDSGLRFGTLIARSQRRRTVEPDSEIQGLLEPEVAAEAHRAELAKMHDNMIVLHLSKAYGSNLAVDDISFGVKPDEVFALLGPNGAGKSTSISMIRGELNPTQGEVYIRGLNLRHHRKNALSQIGVCPQFDPLDILSVSESLRFWARIRGLPAAAVDANVLKVITAVGLGGFKDRMASALSGGNKRRLVLGIALMGNPALILLDEPSSGMDVAAKRIMWRTLQSISKGRSILLVTHSLEEANALADRAGILAKRFLAFGTGDELRRKHGDLYHIHLVLSTAPNSSQEETESIKSWIEGTFVGAQIEARTGHGQLRFSVPATKANISSARTVDAPLGKPVRSSDKAAIMVEEADEVSSSSPQGGQGIATVFAILEAEKTRLGYDYSMQQTSLEQVFLFVVNKHNVAEENYRHEIEESKHGIRRRNWFTRH